MAYQETLKRHNGPVEKPARVIRRNLSDLTHDVITLLELQASLFKLDLKDTAARSIVPLILMFGGAFLVASCLTVALAALAFVLIEFAGLSPSLSFALSALTGAVLGGVALALGWRWFRAGLGTISRSQEEFTRNITWFKQVLKQSVPSHPQEEWK